MLSLQKIKEFISVKKKNTIETQKEKCLGFIEYADSAAITGWCIDLSSEQSLPYLNLVIEGKTIKRFCPTIARHDISEKYNINLLSGFRIEIDDILSEEILACLDKEHHGETISFAIVSSRLKQSLLPLPGVSLYLGVSDLKKKISERVNNSALINKNIGSLNRAQLPDMQRKNDEVRLIAFYLPQFHPFAENNQWWGEGFTEWTNVTKAKPLFSEHYQPHLPADLGFYDLRLNEVREQQANLAKKYGIYGFCYHYYWFSGRKLMETPIEMMLKSEKPDFPFCICWANESWSRRWDGSENELLMYQEHDLETDKEFIIDILPFLKDSRYICVDNAPLIIIYRVELIPDPIALFTSWRKLAEKNGIPKIHIVMAETFGLRDPFRYGCDAAVEFPPHQVTAADITYEMEDLDRENFGGDIFNYKDVVVSELHKDKVDYPLYKCVFPCWDNTARLNHNAHLFTGSTPGLYEIWLDYAIKHTKQCLPSKRQIVFINAWNEWAEGAHLEPDRKFGKKYLEATRRALRESFSFSRIIETVRISEDDEILLKKNEIETISQQIDILKRSNDFLAKRYEEVFDHLNIKKTEFVNVAASFNDTIIWDQHEYPVNIESINQYSQPNIPNELLVDSREFIFFKGWFYTDEESFNNALLYLVLQDVDNKLTCAFVKNRYDRLDVVNHFGSNSFRKPGFEFSIDLSSSFLSGKQKIGFIYTDGTTWRGFHTHYVLDVCGVV